MGKEKNSVIILLKETLKYIYRIDLTWNMCFLSLLYIIPIYFYTIKIYVLYKEKRESIILTAGIAVLILSIPVNLYLIKIYNLTGALMAGAAGEILTIFFYYTYGKVPGIGGRSLKNQAGSSQAANNNLGYEDE